MVDFTKRRDQGQKLAQTGLRWLKDRADDQLAKNPGLAAKVDQVREKAASMIAPGTNANAGTNVGLVPPGDAAYGRPRSLSSTDAESSASIATRGAPAEGFLAAPTQTSHLQHRRSLDPYAFSNLSLSDAGTSTTFFVANPKPPNQEIKPRRVPLLPRTHPLQPHSIRCHACARIIYAGETFSRCTSCQLGSGAGFILCETSPRCVLARVNHEHPMEDCRVVIREGVQPEEFNCALCGETCEGWDWVDCGGCERSKYCHACHRNGKQTVHEASCPKSSADSVWISDGEEERSEGRGKEGVVPCFECNTWMGFNEVTYSCTGCTAAGKPFALCFHCRDEHTRSLPILSHCKDHELNLLPDIMIVDPSTAGDGRLGETWDCLTCHNNYSISETRAVCRSCNNPKCVYGACPWTACPHCTPNQVLAAGGRKTLWAERKAALTQQYIASCEGCHGRIAIFQGFYRCKLCATEGDVFPGMPPKGIYCHRCYERADGKMPHFSKHGKGVNWWNVCLSTRDWDARFENGARFNLKCRGFCDKTYRFFVPSIRTTKNGRFEDTMCLPCFWLAGFTGSSEGKSGCGAEILYLRLILGVPEVTLALPREITTPNAPDMAVVPHDNNGAARQSVQPQSSEKSRRPAPPQAAKSQPTQQTVKTQTAVQAKRQSATTPANPAQQARRVAAPQQPQGKTNKEKAIKAAKVAGTAVAAVAVTGLLLKGLSAAANSSSSSGHGSSAGRQAFSAAASGLGSVARNVAFPGAHMLPKPKKKRRKRKGHGGEEEDEWGGDDLFGQEWMMADVFGMNAGMMDLGSSWSFNGGAGNYDLFGGESGGTNFNGLMGGYHGNSGVGFDSGGGGFGGGGFGGGFGGGGGMDVGGGF